MRTVLCDRRICIVQTQILLILVPAIVSPASVRATRRAGLGPVYLERAPVQLLSVQGTDGRSGALC